MNEAKIKIDSKVFKVKPTTKGIGGALNIALSYGQIDGDHHKTWVIDQMVRALTGKQYKKIVEAYCRVEDNPDDCYTWDEGIAP